MLALQTDMNIPTDVSHVRIVVLKNGAVKFDQKYRVGKDGEEIPATLGIIASDNPSDTTEVRVLSLQGTKVRTLNRVVTTIPRDRIATLNVPIQWLCDGQVKRLEAAAEEYDSSCDDPEAACIAGECRKVYVDSITLPDFKISDVTGGSETPAEGLCYDTAACLDLGKDVTPDEECRISVPRSAVSKLNVGLLLPPDSGGICGTAGNCYIPLDSNQNTGFHVVDSAGESATVALPKAVCSKIANGAAKAVRISDACVTKTPSIPTCGPWTSVGTRNPNKGPSGGGGSSGSHSGEGGATNTGGIGFGGTGGSQSSGCPGFAEGNRAPISDDPSVDQFARLVLTLEQQVRQVRRSVRDACANVLARLTADNPGSSESNATDAEIEQACGSAKQLFSEIPVTWHLAGGGENCRANVVEQLSLEQSCPAREGCELATPRERCDFSLGTCDATCVGACVPGDTMLNVACEGRCEGQCVGTCEGRCIGPGGNSLPSEDCMGLCEGTCSGTCQGSCVASKECAGLCRGECTGNIEEYYCDAPLSLPDCALTSSCENLAAATAAVHRVCSPGTVFVSGQTEPDVAPAIADNLPMLQLAQSRSQGLYLGAYHLQTAASSLFLAADPEPQRACLEAAFAKIPTLIHSLQFAIEQGESLAWMMSAEPDSTAHCVPNTADDACASCVKSNCCEALSVCAATPGCMTSANCFRGCVAQPGNDHETCATQCGTDSYAQAFMACQDTSCRTACGASEHPTAGECVASGPVTYLLDDFEDRDTVTPIASWRVTNPDGFLGSLSVIEPGARDSKAAMGVAGSPDPGMSVDFNSCMDARESVALAFQAMSPDAAEPIPLTIRVRTRPNEYSSRGGACSGSQCGDYHSFATAIPGRSFAAVRVPWTSVLDSGRNPPDLSQIIGIDFVLFGDQAQQIVIDDVQFAGPNP